MLKINIDEIIIRERKNKRKILSKINFELEPNHIYTILGKNGSGKSTLIKSFTRLLNNKFYSVKGEVFFNNKNLFTAGDKVLMEIRKNKIKYIFQDAMNSFDHLKAFKYYFEKLAKDESEIDNLLEFFLLPVKHEIYKLYPYEVSGGMAQRINFVLALLSHPQIIILDEPTSGIDPAIANLFLLKLKEFVKYGTNSALLVTQDLTFANSISDKIAYLLNGQLSDFYSAKEFFQIKDPDWIRTIKQFIKAHQQI